MVIYLPHVCSSLWRWMTLEAMGRGSEREREIESYILTLARPGCN